MNPYFLILIEITEDQQLLHEFIEMIQFEQILDSKRKNGDATTRRDEHLTTFRKK